MSTLAAIRAVLLGLTFPLGAWAQGNPELEELKAQVAALNQKILDMEAREAAQAKAAAPVAQEAKAAKPRSWSDRISVTGDFRYRSDGTDEEGREYVGLQRLR